MSALKTIILLMACYASPVLAANDWEKIIDTVLSPASFMIQTVYAVCYIVGIGLVLGSFLQYKTYRINPTQIRLSQPVALFVFGILLLLTPIIAQLSAAVK